MNRASQWSSLLWAFGLIAALPVALIRLTPAGALSIPDRQDLVGWLHEPLTPGFITAVVILAGWLLWAAVAAALLTQTYTRLVRHCRRLPRLRIPGPIQGLYAAALGIVAVSNTTAGTPAPVSNTVEAPTAGLPDGRPLRALSHVTSPSGDHEDSDGGKAAKTARHHVVRLSDRPAPAPRHRVVAGDTLWDIAARKLDDPHRWPQIHQLNRGHRQANGYALTDPDEIHIGWILTLPTRDPAPTPPQAEPGAPTDPTPAQPGATGPATTDPGQSDAQPTVAPTTPPATAAPAPSPPAGGASPTVSPSPPEPAAQPNDSHDDGGVTLPAGGWVSLALAATIAAVTTGLRLQRRRHARITFPIPVGTGPQPAPVPGSLALLDAVGHRHLTAGTAGRQAPAPVVPVPAGVDANGAEVSLFDLPGPGIALHGDGAEPAARAILAAALTTGAAEPAIDARPVVVTTDTLLARLLPEDASVTGLDADGTSFDGERLIVLADTAAAITHAEEEMIGRRRLLDTFDGATVTDLNARADHAEHQPPYVLLIDANARHAGRLGAVAAHRAALDLHPVIVGTADGVPAFEVAANGAVTGDEATVVRRLATLTASDLAAVLAMLTEAVARPESGHDIDDPTPEAPEVAAPTEPIPAQQQQSPALVRLRVLGPVAVATDTGPITTGMRSGSYTALTLLAAHPAGRTLDQLAAALHPDTNPTVAAKRIRTDINAARRVLREATDHAKAMFVIYDPGTGRYRLDPEMVAVDLWQMLTAIDQANTATDDTAALAALRDAAQLYGGDFADNQDRPWATDYATTYRHQILTVYARIAEILEADHPEQAVAALERAVDLDPVNEELYQRIMRIQGRQHRPDAVRRTLRRLEDRLADLDAEPSHATRRVAERQLRPESAAGVQS